MLYLTLEAQHKIGQSQQYGSHAPQKDNFVVMFEDDGNTGYFYAIDTTQEQAIVDSLHLYNVESISEEMKAETYHLQICWAAEGNFALLLLNDHPQAAFDFVKLIGYNQTHFPEPELGSMWSREKLVDELVTKFIN